LKGKKKKEGARRVVVDGEHGHRKYHPYFVARFRAYNKERRRRKGSGGAFDIP
jgi:hypothetical protein